MKTAVIVQARIASSRLPGKVLRDLTGAPVLIHVLTRCRAIPGIDEVVCATTTGSDTDAVVQLANDFGAAVFRGSEEDVLDRYLGAARLVDADIVMRVTSDCPVIDPEVCGAVLVLRREENADYASNNLARSWPHGLDCEAFTRGALERAATQARDPYEREHVTPWLRTRPDLKTANLASPRADLAGQRWTLDFPEDYSFFQALFSHLPPLPHISGWREIMAVIDKHPEIAAINANRRVPI